MLAKARIVEQDFESLLLKEVQKGDFVYLDPPYAMSNRRVFRQYGPDVFGTADLDRLAKLLHTINRRGAHFVVSYGWCAEAIKAFSTWPTKKVFTQRNIAGFAASRRKSAELIVTNITC